jgi:hypothetical protein
VIAEDEQDVAASLYEWLSRASLPGPQFAEALESTYLPLTASIPSLPPDNKLLNLKHNITLTCLLHLTNASRANLTGHIPSERLSAIIATLAAFTSTKNPWSTAHSSSLASSILQKWLSPSTSRESFQCTLSDVLKTILRTRIKTLFTPTPNVHITSSGRKHLYSQPDPKWAPHNLGDHTETPWKHESVWAVPVLEWVLNQYRTIEFKDFEEHIPLLVPPILTLIDDTSISFKIQGCRLLLQMLLHLSNAEGHSPAPLPAKELLRKTGLDDVFFEALMSCTLYLPTLTPEPESAVLLRKSYAALLALDAVRWPENDFPQGLTGKSPDANAMNQVERSKRLSRLRQVMSKGLLGALHHIRMDHPRVAHVLITGMMPVLDALNVEAVRYLQDIIPVLNAHLSHPFATSSPSLLAATIKTYETVIRVCNPRIDVHYAKILEGPCACWYQIQNDGSLFQADDVKDSLRHCVQSLKESLKERLPKGTFDEEIAILLKENGWLAGLFG